MRPIGKCVTTKANNAINTDSKKRRAFVALLFTAGYGERWATKVADRTPTNTLGGRNKS